MGEGNGTPLQYSCLDNPMDGGAWWSAVHGVAESRTQLSDFTFTFHFHALEKEMATHSSTLAWRIPGMGEPGGLPSMGSHRVRHDWSDLAAAAGFLIAFLPRSKRLRNYQFSSVAQSCLTLCDLMDCDAIQPSHPLLSPSPPAFNLSQHQGLFKWVSSLHQVARVLEFQCQRQSFQGIFRTDFL